MIGTKLPASVRLRLIGHPHIRLLPCAGFYSHARVATKEKLFFETLHVRYLKLLARAQLVNW
jgi:hypothetical protein